MRIDKRESCKMQDNSFLNWNETLAWLTSNRIAPHFKAKLWIFKIINEKISLKCNLSKSCSKFHASRQFHGVYDVSISKTIQNHRQKKAFEIDILPPLLSKEGPLLLLMFPIPIPSYFADPCPTLTECNVGNKEKSQSHEKGEKSVLREWFSVKPIFFSLSHTIIFLSRGGRGILRQDKVFSGNNKWRAK